MMKNGISSIEKALPVKILGACQAFLVILLLFSFQAPAANEICRIEPVGGQLGERANRVLFPDGRRITVIGHAHGETKDILKLEGLFADTTSSNEDFLAVRKKDLQEVDLTLKHFRAEVDFLLSEVHAKAVNFVALEAGNKVLEYFSDGTTRLFVFGQKNLEKRKLNEPQVFRDSILAYGGPGRYVKLFYPETRDKYEIVGVEDDEVMQASLDAIDEAASQLGILYQRLPAGHPFRVTASNMVDNAKYNYQAVLKFSEDAVIREFLDISPPEARIQMPKFIRTLYKLARLMRERDEKTRIKLLNQKGSGIYFVGFAHLQSQSELLRDACLRQTGNFSSGTIGAK